MFDFEILKKVDATKWDNQLTKSNYATFFQAVEYLSTDSDNKFPLFFYVYDKNGDVKGQLGLMITKTQRAYSSPLLKKYMENISKLGNRCTWVAGPIIHSSDQSLRIEILQTFIKALDVVSKQNNIMLLDGYSPPQDLNVEQNYKIEFQKNGYNIRNLLTFATDLSNDTEDIWKNVKKSARNDVTRAKRRNISIKEIKNREDLVNYELLTKSWAETKGITLNDPLASLEKDWESCKLGIQKFFLAYKNNEVISGLRIGCFNGIAYTHQVLSSYSKEASLGGPLLTWHAIEWAKDSNMRIYDFSGVESPSESKNEKEYKKSWEGLTSYKKKWGGKEFAYYHFVKVVKKKSYKMSRMLSKPDWLYRNYKKKRYVRPKKE